MDACFTILRSFIRGNAAFLKNSVKAFRASEFQKGGKPSLERTNSKEQFWLSTPLISCVNISIATQGYTFKANLLSTYYLRLLSLPQKQYVPNGPLFHRRCSFIPLRVRCRVEQRDTHTFFSKPHGGRAGSLKYQCHRYVCNVQAPSLKCKRMTTGGIIVLEAFLLRDKCEILRQWSRLRPYSTFENANTLLYFYYRHQTL